MLVMSIGPVLGSLVGVVALAGFAVAFLIVADRTLTAQGHDWQRANSDLTWRVRHPALSTLRKTCGFVAMMAMILPVMGWRKLRG